MTIDEAIRHAEEVAQRQDIKEDEEELFSEMLGDMYSEFKMNCTNCAAEHRQLAEWLRELKKAKRILKDALITLNDGSCNKDCRKCVHNSDGCDYSCRFKWKHTDEVIKLIGGDDECI